MTLTRRDFLAAVPVAACAVSALADEAKKEEPKSDPAGVPLELTLVAKKDVYLLNLGGKSAKEFRKTLAAVDGGGPIPPTPTVDLELEVKNTGEKALKVFFGGDPTILTLELKGKGVEVLKPLLAMTREFRIPETVTLEPGKSKTIPIKNLTSGVRNASVFSYWTEPGEHTLTATYRTGVSPKPKDAKDAGEGFGVVTLTSRPIKVKVEEKQ